jgi:hypothetical protein
MSGRPPEYWPAVTNRLNPWPSAREAAAKAAQRTIVRLAPRVGLKATRETFYSPIPELPPQSDPLWRKEYPFPLDYESQLAYIESDLTPHVEEFGDRLRRRDLRGYDLHSGQYRSGDAELLYAQLRRLAPRRVIELGSGSSTLVTAAACEQNAAEGTRAEVIAADPQPRIEIGASVSDVIRIERRDCRELGLDPFEALAANDVLFIDTSHVAKLGGEVVWLFLEVLPRLAPGVWVHAHDIFIPYEYPRSLLTRAGYFNEQYLVHAFVLGNSDWRVELAAFALQRRYRERLARLIPSLRERGPDFLDPSAFWIRRVDD